MGGTFVRTFVRHGLTEPHSSRPEWGECWRCRSTTGWVAMRESEDNENASIRGGYDVMNIAPPATIVPDHAIATLPTRLFGPNHRTTVCFARVDEGDFGIR